MEIWLNHRAGSRRHDLGRSSPAPQVPTLTCTDERLLREVAQLGRAALARLVASAEQVGGSNPPFAICGVEQWQLAGLITRKSVVRIHPPLFFGSRRSCPVEQTGAVVARCPGKGTTASAKYKRQCTRGRGSNPQVCLFPTRTRRQWSRREDGADRETGLARSV